MSNLNTGSISDGYHTFDELYEQRLYLSAALFNAYPERSWKSKQHSDGESCFGGSYFIAGIETDEGSFTYHYENKHWALFNVVELEKAPEWDGHTAKDVERVMHLQDEVSPSLDWARKELDLAGELLSIN